MRQFRLGKTIGGGPDKPKRDPEEVPSPDKYNVHLPDDGRNIINFRGPRSDLVELEAAKNPSPLQYDTRGEITNNGVTFARFPRKEPPPDGKPGVGTYQVERSLGNTLGHMGLRLKELSQF
ncbi:unnamed protein product [Sphagnum balticum]